MAEIIIVIVDINDEVHFASAGDTDFTDNPTPAQRIAANIMQIAEQAAVEK